jgi:hypothetical protein
MSVGIIGAKFPFSFLALNSDNKPVEGLTAYITIFSVDKATGARIVVKDSQVMFPTDVPGRFTYIWDIPDTFNDKDNVYGEMWANDIQDPTLRYVAEQEVTLTVLTTGSGLRSRFIK